MANIWNEDDFFLKEEVYTQRMSEEVDPFLTENLRETTISSADGTQLRCYYLLNPAEKAAVVISHGFCEFFGKFQETAYYLYQAGYSVFFVQYRGHGHSQRYVDDLYKVHLQKGFGEYVADLQACVDKLVRPNSSSGRFYLYAHSMGGAIGTMFLETFPDVFEKAVLSSPMMEANYAGIPIGVVRILVGIGKLLHWEEKWAPGQKAFSGVPDFEGGCSQSLARYEREMRLRLADSQCQNSGGTYGWVMGAVQSAALIKKNAAKVKIPVLLLQAGLDTLVSLEAQDYFIGKAERAKKVFFPNAKHEIYNGLDDDVKGFYTSVLDFFAD